MTNYTTITIRANADADDCLAAAVEEFVDEHPEASGYDLSPRWKNEDREEVLLDVREEWL